MRYGQTPTTVYWSKLAPQIFGLQDWPQIKTNFGPQPLGSVYQKSSKSYIIDPAFDWSKGTRINDADLLAYLNGKSFSPGDVKEEKQPSPSPGKKAPYVPPQGNFCARTDSMPCSKKPTPPACASKPKEKFVYTRAGVY